ncbi:MULTISPECIES: hypothetical protein [Bradyrhizobium]|uniref:hypothetical protein n=1 Tax=Bradyrhizobium TaxID=374 RepID=UPI00155EF5A3|nr:MULTISPECIES: hypothetical protein [Bradyrhizobium]MDD1520008.1 hypothetical protein [Bradyrhizobium sp. WBAH30]MDD1544252.1 hypothetical protein [Bradyrhizobium sp. WBAH41]MDD1558134.1 hypothetical protein [Bradyrhizobium sp. WBAH23]MDD1565532.1 hypothetical protein [Bradyrhizobium sp. WBAH33]NRB89210.1 hypothetical protein [Bradyrhizobium sp. WBAH10]
MPSQVFSPDIPKTAEEIELEDVIRRLVYRLDEVREDSAEARMILRQLEGIRRGSELFGLLMQEYDMGGMSAVNHW